MRKTREQIEYQLSIKRNRLELYLKREAEMLDGGVQSYGIGSRNLARYNTDLGTFEAWDGTKWGPISGGAYVGDTAPANPQNGILENISATCWPSDCMIVKRVSARRTHL
jgi:hypothetical protein